MRFFVGLILFCFGVSLFTIRAHAELIVFPVVGEYESSAQGNTVDLNADFYAGNSSGEGDNASLIAKIESFRDEIKKAFTNECGGVVGFDNAIIPGGTQCDGFMASFSEDKFLVVRSVDNIRTDFVATNICIPISDPGEGQGGGFLAKSNIGGDRIKLRSSFDFTFSEEGFAEGEHVREVGATILGRNGAAETSKWLMKVKLDNGDIIAGIAELNFRSGNARQDTFFGASAPRGRYITGMALINLDGSYTGLDGFAFITNGAPKKKKAPAVSPGTTSPSDSLFGIPVNRGSSGSSEDDDDRPADNYSLLFGTER